MNFDWKGLVSETFKGSIYQSIFINLNRGIILTIHLFIFYLLLWFQLILNKKEKNWS